ncbi:uncharacterized protein LOC117643780 [Thrips palmi]|uniref:Uncharacterized protein LOC117643780 n=1 Tax=Thrips palmi TaxID=161013 RepID=A0A6P8YPE5_THRPL|nr:uncharacterized protein LOC117643780 [Thrips palmi]
MAIALKNAIVYSTLGDCSVCGAPKSRACSTCYVDFYCGRDHQKEDWARHKVGCGAVEVPEGKKWLVAARDIPAGTRIMREVPAISFPKLPSGSEDGCLCRGCFTSVSSTSRCKSCGLPLCRQGCDPDGLHRAECALLEKADFKSKVDKGVVKLGLHASYALTVLRTYLWLNDHPQMHQVLASNMDVDEASLSEVAKAVWHYTRDWLLKELGVLWIVENRLRRALLLAVRNHLLTHKEQPSKGYVMMSNVLLEQACQPNTFSVLSPLDTGLTQHVVLTARLVRRGERLSMDHLENSLMEEAQRRSYLRYSDMQCSCKLCSDPTRLGLHLNSWPCSHCKKGMAVPLPAVGEEEPDARCNNCHHLIPSTEMRAAKSGPLRRLDCLEKVAEKSPWAWAQFLQNELTPVGALHPTHSIALRAKLHFIFAINFVDISLERNEEELIRWEALIRDFLRTLEVLIPGHSCIRNRVLGPFVQVLFGRFLHLWNRDEPDAVCKVPLDEADRLIKEMDVVVSTYKEGQDTLKKIRMQHTMWSAALTMQFTAAP